jgi:hypothetical protein
MMVIVRIVVFWIVTPCSLAGGYRCFGGTSSALRYLDTLAMKVTLTLKMATL